MPRSCASTSSSSNAVAHSSRRTSTLAASRSRVSSSVAACSSRSSARHSDRISGTSLTAGPFRDAFPGARWYALSARVQRGDGPVTTGGRFGDRAGSDGPSGPVSQRPGQTRCHRRAASVVGYATPPSTDTLGMGFLERGAPRCARHRVLGHSIRIGAQGDRRKRPGRVCRADRPWVRVRGPVRASWDRKDGPGVDRPSDVHRFPAGAPRPRVCNGCEFRATTLQAALRLRGAAESAQGVQAGGRCAGPPQPAASLPRSSSRWRLLLRGPSVGTASPDAHGGVCQLPLLGLDLPRGDEGLGPVAWDAVLIDQTRQRPGPLGLVDALGGRLVVHELIVGRAATPTLSTPGSTRRQRHRCLIGGGRGSR